MFFYICIVLCIHTLYLFFDNLLYYVNGFAENVFCCLLSIFYFNIKFLNTQYFKLTFAMYGNIVIMIIGFVIKAAPYMPGMFILCYAMLSLRHAMLCTRCYVLYVLRALCEVCMKKEKYIITGMTCSACSARVQKAVDRLPGIRHAVVNLLTNSMQIEYDEKQLTAGAITAAVEKAGYGIRPAGQDGGREARPAGGGAAETGRADGAEDVLAGEARALKKRLIWSLAFLLPLMYIAMYHMLSDWLGLPAWEGFEAVFYGRENAVTFAFAQFLLMCPVLLLNRRYFINGFRNLFGGSPNMDSLVGMGAAASAVFGIFAIFRMSWGMGHGDWPLVEEYSRSLYFESAGMIVTLITVGKYLEAKAKSSTGDALKKLMDLVPRTAVVVRGGSEMEIPAEELVPGDEVIVRPGGAVAADGVVLEGSASLNEAAITGEAAPVHKKAGDRVISASVNLDGYIRFRAEKVGSESAISQIVRLVDEASATKAPVAKLADRISGVFVPVVIGIALLTGIVWLLLGAGAEFAFSAAVAVLVISCPCALGLATPVAIMTGTGKGAERGILIKSGEILERAKSIDTVILDKTGTITAGRPQVTDVLCHGAELQELLQKAASLEQASQHPLGQAVVALARSKGIGLRKAEDFVNEPGMGISGVVDGEKILLGNSAYLEAAGFDTAAYRQKTEAMADEGKTVLFAADSSRLLGMFAIADREKPSSRQAVKILQENGLEVIMLTGDNRRTAQAVAARVGIRQVFAQVLPQEKEKLVRQQQERGRVVAMAGDGINDAPALARADVGIAVGAGTDIALESADVVLVGNDLRHVADTIALSRAVLRNIKENLFWAFFYNVIGIPLAAGLLYPAFGLKLSPMIGAAAMSMSSVCVVLNALRLKRFRFSDGGSEPAEGAEQPDSGVKIAFYEGKCEKRAGKDDAVMKTELKIEGMMCMHCQKHVHDALSKMDGVTSVDVNLANKSAVVEAVREIPAEEFRSVIADAGYELV